MEYKEIKINLEQAKELLKTTPAFSDVIYENFPELKPKKRWFEEYKGGDYGVIQGSLSGVFMSNFDIKLKEASSEEVEKALVTIKNSI